MRCSKSVNCTENTVPRENRSSCSNSPSWDDRQLMDEQVSVRDVGRHFEFFWIPHRVASHVLVGEKDMPVVSWTKKTCPDFDQPLLSLVGQSGLGDAPLFQPRVVKAVRAAYVEILGVCRERKQMRRHEMFH